MKRAAMLALCLAAGGCAHAGEPRGLPPEAEVVRARTEDGWTLALTRYRPAGAAQGLPVLLCHGIAANSRSVDLDERHSLARWLAARGREVFALDLRGVGSSDRPDASQGRSAGYSIDTYAMRDVPAALEAIRQRTGAARVDFVGHSMGGLIGYAYLARGGQGFNAVVTLGSPARFAWGGRVERALQDAGRRLGRNVALWPVPALGRWTYPLHADSESLAGVLLYNPDNFVPATWQGLVEEGSAAVSGAVLAQFLLSMERESFVSADGRTDYLAALAEVRTPVLVVAGKLDRVAAAPSVRAGFDALGGPKRFFVAGEENGLAHDYGHLDLVLGERAAEELWPRVLGFLEEQGG